jgi:hypothetical protein
MAISGEPYGEVSQIRMSAESGTGPKAIMQVTRVKPFFLFYVTLFPSIIVSVGYVRSLQFLGIDIYSFHSQFRSRNPSISSNRISFSQSPNRGEQAK